MSQSDRWDIGHLTGSILESELNEASGLAASAHNPGILWSHNDSGDRPRVFVLNTKGRVLGTVALRGVPAYDIEDIAIGPCAKNDEDAKTCLIVADIGDNRHKLKSIRLYHFPLPTLNAERTLPKSMKVVAIEHLKYPKGPHDAETLLVHPKTGARYLVQKSRKGASGVFKVPAGESSYQSAKTLVHLFDLRPKSINLSGRLFTGGDISPDGRCAALRTYTHVHTYCAKNADSFIRAFDNKPDLFETPPMLQSEALTFDPKTGGLWITSERWPAPLLYVPPRKVSQ